jgi:UDP-N-acetylmuramyl pentapeptide phosphotransferase/UDP-N-acetylglucosamine-1-phosphate transferase
LSVRVHSVLLGAVYYWVMLPWALFFGALALTFLTAFPVRALLVRAGILDRPNERSSHATPTVRGGGLAIMTAILLGLAGLAIVFPRPELWGLFAGAALLAVISWIDDIRSLPSSVRFLAHAAAAGVFLACLGFPLLTVDLGGGWEFALPLAVSGVVGFLWLAGYTNAFNFMDGINGISGSQAGITGLATAVMTGLALGDWTHPVVLSAVLVAGAAFGFLPHNFPKARMFMGDVSSAPVGFLLAAVALWAAVDAGWWLLIPLALLHANYVFDTGITLVRRVLRGESWHSAHREHFYQRLVRSGKSHTFTTGWEAVLQLGVAGLMIAYSGYGTSGRLALIVVVVAVWALFFIYCEWRFRAANGGCGWVKKGEAPKDSGEAPRQQACASAKPAPRP